MKSQGAWGRSRRRAASAVLLLIASACSGQVGLPKASSSEPTSAPIQVCEVAVLPPSSFVQFADTEVPDADHIGVRVSYRGPQGQRLHYTSGIIGEFGEALPTTGEIETAGGYVGRLLGQDGGTDWIFTWMETDACQQRAITGNGFTREQFLMLLVRSEVIPPMSH